MAVRPGGADDPLSRIERLVEQQERRFRSVFLQAIELIKNSRTLDEIADLLERGRLEDALSAVDDAARLLGTAYGAALSAAATDTAQFLTNNALTVAVGFDVTNQRAVDAIQRNSLRLISGFSQGQRQTIRQAMSRGIAQGLNPRELARLFRDTVGLTPLQESAVANYEAMLRNGNRDALRRELRDRRFDSTVNRAFRDRQPLSDDQVSRMVGAYRSRYIRYRAEVIGRTEGLRSAHEGVEEMYNQAIDSGQILPEEILQRWNTTQDGRQRDSHDSLNGQERAWGEAWQADEGELRYPGDPNAPPSETAQCRCRVSRRLRPVPR